VLGAAASSLTGTLASAPSTASLLAADDFFGEVFLAGMSIAAAAIGATLFIGIIVRSNYDNIEKSFFERQVCGHNTQHSTARRHACVRHLTRYC
jgi:hypothetical protein